MSDRNFPEMRQAQFGRGNHLCVGLDPVLGKIPQQFRNPSDAQTLIAFNYWIIDQVQGSVGFFKPNTEFYAAHGPEGFRALRETIRRCNEVVPDAPVILDRKAGDIGNTNDGTVKFAFEEMGADAITLNPYLGREAMKPFLDRADKGCIFLCKTSNPGSGEFQNLLVGHVDQRMFLYEYIAQQVMAHWNSNGNCGLVVGATYPKELEQIRAIAPNMPILCPGIGTQGGDLDATITAAGCKDFIINSSSGIIFDKNPGVKADGLHEQIRASIIKSFVKPIN